MNLPTYGSYKISNIIWVGNYPSEWFITKVKYEAYVKARVGWHGLKSDDFTDEGPFLVTGSDFKSSRIHWADCYHCDLNRYEQDPYIQLRNGDLLITKDGTIGKVALIDGLKPNEKATLNSGVFVVRPLVNNFSTKFYFWLLQSKVFTDFVDYNKTGSTIVHLYQDTFVNFSYASPQLKEQIQIAAFLDHETAKIDNLIEKQQQLIELLKEKRQAVISHAVTKGLNPDVPMKDSGVEWLGEVPAHWIVSGFKKYLSSIVDYRGKTPNKTDDGILLVTARNIKKGRLDYTLSQEFIALSDYKEVMSRGLPDIGDVLFTTEAPLGEVANVDRVDIALAQRVIKFKGMTSRLDNYYFKYFIMSSAFQQSLNLYSSGSTAQGIKAERFVYLKKLLPPINEQIKIVDFLDKEICKIDMLVEQQFVMLSLLQERRTALISAAVTGKIDIRDWVAPDTQDIEASQEVIA